jgi:hypothetical protein
MDQKVRAIEYTFVAALCQARGLVSASFRPTQSRFWPNCSSRARRMPTRIKNDGSSISTSWRKRAGVELPFTASCPFEVFSKDVSGCSTASYDISFLVRNEEVAGSIPVSSTKLRCFAKAGCSIRLSKPQGTGMGLAIASGGELEQIQFLLGHVSVQTTERYLGCKQRIRSAVNDRIGIEPNP